MLWSETMVWRFSTDIDMFQHFVLTTIDLDNVEMSKVKSHMTEDCILHIIPKIVQIEYNAELYGVVE